MKPDFSKSADGLLPAIVQDARTKRVLMQAYMNEDAYTLTQQTQRATFWSRSRNALWTKGETSGHYLHVKEMLLDCDADSILIKALPEGPVCHTGAATCWNEANEPDFLVKLEELIQSRRHQAPESSYTAQLLARGINKVAQKVGEEAVELVIEAKDDNRDLFLGEAADLLYHYLVLLTAKNCSLADVLAVLEKRHHKQ
ncbi:MAG: bifunctional phosphoribosyl-AMP cyclohydrolase/phosphoribosyl-ATP diphosphatase HisIE [Bacteroidia bacterium]|jgi:phosphoribosyl-ATP pyrophosphohydrolase/phosphoribosyl-AMP cyclohydrolase|nr:bifunctional phosphoribosyl-AMP cyclohydrolase/phosphoribosyl-ATP diphosphatase HisIE [Bacteroidia bacterium]